MKRLLLIFAVALSPLALAQSVDVKSIGADEDSTTTIQIKKGKKDEPPLSATASKWTVEEGNADVEGEPSATGRDARAAWKTACEDWKKEFRNDNKDNKIVSMSCGSATCGGDAGSKTCTSKATYKVKTRND